MNDYNTKRRALPLPEYGRSVQNMVDHCLTITDREERQLCAETIVQIMEGMFPQQKGVEDFQHKLWDHLALMADYKLDIDFPFEIIPRSEEKPEPLPYDTQAIRYRHYGKLLERLISKLPEYPEGDEKQELVAQTLQQMKRSMAQWNTNTASDQKILDDLKSFTGGKVEGDLQMLQDVVDKVAHAAKKSSSKKKKK